MDINVILSVIGQQYDTGGDLPYKENSSVSSNMIYIGYSCFQPKFLLRSKARHKLMIVLINKHLLGV
jgi:hypothetical protein